MVYNNVNTLYSEFQPSPWVTHSQKRQRLGRWLKCSFLILLKQPWRLLVIWLYTLENSSSTQKVKQGNQNTIIKIHIIWNISFSSVIVLLLRVVLKGMLLVFASFNLLSFRGRLSSIWKCLTLATILFRTYHSPGWAH